MSKNFMNEPVESNNIRAKNRAIFSSINNIVDRNANSFKNTIIDLIMGIGKTSFKKVQNRYSYSISITDNYTIGKFVEYLKTVDKKFEKRPITYNGDTIKNIDDCFFMVNIAENTFMTVLVGNPYLSYKEKYIIDSYRNNNKVIITIYGKYAKLYYNIISKEIMPTKGNTELSIFNITGNSKGKDESFQSIITDLNPRDIDTLFYEEGVKEDVISHIDSFFKNRDIYASRNINYKYSMILHGLPGTGKSSLARALATKYGLDIILVDMNTFATLDVNMLTSCINGDDKTYIVLLEDIDTIYNTNRDTDDLDKDDRKVINKLLQFLDSNSSPNNVIFIATTNHIEKLDAAITRKGRFDHIIEIGPINKKEARKMCNAFGCTSVQTDNILSEFGEDVIKQCDLQSTILDQLKKEIN